MGNVLALRMAISTHMHFSWDIGPRPYPWEECSSRTERPTVLTACVTICWCGGWLQASHQLVGSAGGLCLWIGGQHRRAEQRERNFSRGSGQTRGFCALYGGQARGLIFAYDSSVIALTLSLRRRADPAVANPIYVAPAILNSLTDDKRFTDSLLPSAG